MRVAAGVQHCRGPRGWCPPPRLRAAPTLAPSKENRAGSRDASRPTARQDRAQAPLRRLLSCREKGRVSVLPLHGPDEEVMDGGVTSRPSFWSCCHHHRLEAVRRRFWARATPHVPPQPSRRTGRLRVGRGGPSCFLIVPMMDASSPAGQEGGLAKPCARDSPPKLLLGVAPLGPFHTDVCLTRK